MSAADKSHRVVLLEGLPAGSLLIHEIYRSLQGESLYAGLPCVFVRLAVCDARCVWCDTPHAFNQGVRKSTDEVLAAALAFGTPLVEITKGEPQYFETYVRLATGVCDLRARPMWAPGWEAIVRVRFDADMFKLEDVANLIMRVGQQVGIGEGRPDSPNSTGQGFGLFDLVGQEGVEQ